MKRILGVLVVLVLVAGLTSLASNLTTHTTSNNRSSSLEPRSMLGPTSSGVAIRANLPKEGEITTKQAERSDTSASLRDLAALPPRQAPPRPEVEFPRLDKGKPGLPPEQRIDTAIQKIMAPLAMPTPIQNFDGMYNYWGFIPPDTNGDVGFNHYVQVVNSGLQMWSKTGASLFGPVDINVLWRGFGGQCEIENAGDPIALFDAQANRWLVSQFTTASAPYYQCIAISATADPTGSYHRYAFLTGQTLFEDYPHFGVWPDAYYMTTNEFFSASPIGFAGAGNFAFERDRMVAGDPGARMIYVHLDPPSGGLLPSDLDGTQLPPAGGPNYFMEFVDNGNNDLLNLYKFHVDWTTPSNSTFTGPTAIPVQPFDSNAPNAPQAGTSVRLDSLSDRLMYRLAYRNSGQHETLLANHTVVGGSNQAGIRWYEVRLTQGTPSVFQQGTYAPDATFRWMGSIAMDRVGNIGVGFSASTSTEYPKICYAGRLPSDPPGTLGQGEALLVAGTGSQTSTASRWGDYSSLSVDPTDDCTFWFTTEYLQSTSERSWRTRIGSFRFPSCGGAGGTPTSTVVPTRTPTVTPTVCPNGATVVGVINSSDPVQTGRLVRGNPPTTCAAPRTCPGVSSDTFQRNYDSHTYTNNTGSAICVTVRINSNCGDNALLSAAYLNSYNPTNLCSNYLADMGVAGPSFGYSFNVPAGATYVIVVTENSAGVGCANYTMAVSPCSGGIGPSPTPTYTAVPPSPTYTSTPTPSQCEMNFSDVQPDDYFYNAVQYLYCAGIISGYSDGTFRPYNNTTRAQLTKIVVLVEGWPIDTTGGPHFIDVPESHPFYDYVETAYNHGIITGYTGGMFRPDNNITRAQLSKVIVAARGWPIDTTGGPHFIDVPPSHAFYNYIETAYNHGIITGYQDSTFRPDNNATRGQVSVIVYRAIGNP